MTELPVEEEHLDILQNTEFAIHQVYKSNPQLTDYDVDFALEALAKTYLGEAVGKPPVLPRSPLSIQIYKDARLVCDFRLGRISSSKKVPIEPISVDVILLCLKRLRKSIRLWTKEGGRQGYLHYISQFMP